MKRENYFFRIFIKSFNVIFFKFTNKIVGDHFLGFEFSITVMPWCIYPGVNHILNFEIKYLYDNHNPPYLVPATTLKKDVLKLEK